MAKTEIPLSGGNTNPGVVRVADTVRRTCGKTAPTVHRFLEFLSKEKFDQSPRFLGIDQAGREILSYLPGACEVTEDQWKRDSYLVSAASLLREYHDCSSKFLATESDQWAYSYPDVTQHQVICHNDFAPYNLINDGHKFVSIIDFDLIGPGPRLRDIAYCAYWITPLSQRNNDMREYALADIRHLSRRLKLLCRTYGIVPDASLLEMVSAVLKHMADEKAMIDTIGADSAAKIKSEGHLAHWKKEADAFDSYRDTIEANL